MYWLHNSCSPTRKAVPLMTRTISALALIVPALTLSGMAPAQAAGTLNSSSLDMSTSASVEIVSWLDCMIATSGQNTTNGCAGPSFGSLRGWPAL